MKVAYFCEPQVGGTFSFFTRIRPRLAEREIDFRCIPPLSGERFAGKQFDQVDGVDYVSFPEDDLPAASRMLIDHLVASEYEAVMVLPGCDIVANNLVRYLPRAIRATARVPMITRGTYAPTSALADHLDVIVGVSERVKLDLSGRYGIRDDQIKVVYNGVEVKESFGLSSRVQKDEAFHLMYAGRLSDLDKGVLLLPEILKRLRDAGLEVRLTLAGLGPDEVALRQSFDRLGLSGRVDWRGNVFLNEVDDLLRNADCFILPSRFEGCPNALMEAMAAGCPCVAARIRGSVDQIIEPGQSGLLAEVADPASFADAILALSRDHALRDRLGEGARTRIRERFSLDHMAEGYARILLALPETPDHRDAPLSLDRYTVPRAMLPTWRTRVPVPLKNLARKWLERFGISS